MVILGAIEFSYFLSVFWNSSTESSAERYDNPHRKGVLGMTRN